MMKKLSLFLGMAVVASLSLTNCTEKESLREHPSVSEGIPFEISTELDVKTVNDGLATKWAENDSLNLFHAVAGETSYVSDGKFTLDATREGVFTGELASALDNEQSYDWYAIYPYEKYVKTPAATNSGHRNLGQISNGKYLTQNGNDSKAHLCGAALPLYGVAKSVASDAMPQMQMKNLTSVVAVDVNNTTTEALNVNSIKFTSTEDIVGTYYIDFTGESVKYTMSDAKYVKSTASLTVENSEIAAGAKATFYIPIKPHTAKAGSTLTLSVNGYEKESPSLTKDVTFTAGKIKTLKFDYNSSSVTTEYKSLAELSAAILDGKTEFTLNLTDPAVVTRVCSDNKTIYLQDKTGGMMFFGSNLIPDAKAGTTISGKITGTAWLFNGLPEVEGVDLSGATTGETTEIPYTELTIAELNADFNKYLNMQVKLSGVEVSAAFSNDDKNGEVKQGENTLAIYVKNTTDKYSFAVGQLGDIVVFPAIYNTKKQVYFWAASDFTITGAADVTSVINLGSAFSVNVGETVSLNASTNSTAAIKYSSEDETIATVSAEGVVTGVKEGTVKITASVDAVKGFTAATATTTITVNPAGTVEKSTFVVKSDDVVSNSAYESYSETIDNRGWKITFGGNNKSVGTNKKNRESCKISEKYDVSPVTKNDVASAFASTTKLDRVLGVKCEIGGGSNQDKTEIYLIYSEDGNTFSQITLTKGEQGKYNEASEFEFAELSGYFAILFRSTTTSGNWRLDDVNLTFTYMK